MGWLSAGSDAMHGRHVGIAQLLIAHSLTESCSIGGGKVGKGKVRGGNRGRRGIEGDVEDY